MLLFFSVFAVQNELIQKYFFFFVINIMTLETADYSRIVETIKLLSL